MAHALTIGGATKILRSHPRMGFRAPPYTFEVFTQERTAYYRVSDGKQSITEPIPYVFGNANVAETYVLRHKGKLYESRVSYYHTIDALDWTVGDALEFPPDLETAFGREIDGDEARNCFSCHGTGGTVGGQLHLDGLIAGVDCEACHGPGGRHATAMTVDPQGKTDIFNPKVLGPETQSQDFCGACHRGVDAVAMMPDLGGINNVRFQPYRLYTSRAHRSNDPHFACTACHDPHVELNRATTFYDSKCISCHGPKRTAPLSRGDQVSGSGGSSRRDIAKTCPVDKERCVTCHMPKVEIPGSHFQFTDHRIRIALPGEAYPY